MRKGFATALGMLYLLAPDWNAAAQSRTVKVEGRVIAADGVPVPGATVASFWNVEEKTGEQSGPGGATTDADGRFHLKVDVYNPELTLMALDSPQKNGGLVVVKVDDVDKPVEISLTPAVRLHGTFFSKGLDKAPPWTNVYLYDESRKTRFIQNSSFKGEFSMMVPAGKYKMDAYGSEVRGVAKSLTLRSDQPDLDLGVIELPATVIAMHKGKELPPWSLSDARGVKRDVTLADYRGKWVLVDVWGYWCGPCVRQLGELIDFYEEHAADRDKFEILAFHDGSVKDFAEMDAKTAATKKSIWRGRDLPFPILLDAQNGGRGATVEAYQIQSFPTSLLFDPEGKFVGPSDVRILEKKLPPIPMASRIPRALDGFVALGFDSIPLDKSMTYFSQQARIPIKLDPESLKSAGVDPAAKVPLKLVGGLSLRSWLELVLDPFGLEARPGDEGLVIVKAETDPARREPSKVQKDGASRIEDVLAKPTTFDFKSVTLEDVAQHFEGKTEENFVLDPAGRKAGLIDPEAVVSGSAANVPLREALERLLKPLGLRLVVKEEVVMITK